MQKEQEDILEKKTDKSYSRSEFADVVINNISILKNIGKSYRKKTYMLADIIAIYVDKMKVKHSNMGEKYITDMIANINNIFYNASRYSKYDILEFINLVINYVFKLISYKYTKLKIEPTLPDYTLPEIKDMSKEITKDTANYNANMISKNKQ
jgi:uncharacterized protein (UPF0276 family)